MLLLDITAATLVALLGIWASVGCGPKFLRLVTIISLLLAPLLIPAYEPVIQHTLAVVLIVVGIKLYQGHRPWVQRYSLKSLLLVTTVLATVGTVLVNAPQFEMNQWLEFFGIALAVASLTFVCLWTIVSDKNRWVKTRIFFYCVFFLAVGGHALYFLTYTYQSIGLGTGWSRWIKYSYSTECIVWWLESYVLGGVAASAILISLLFLAKKSRWFETDTMAQTSGISGATLASRISFLCLLVAVMVLPSYVFYRLMTPTPIPVVELPDPNGYDDLVAAGNMLNDDFKDMSINFAMLSDSRLEAEVANIANAQARIDLGLSREFADPNPYPPYGEDCESDWESILNVYRALSLRLERSQRNGTSSEYAEDSLRMTRLLHAINQSGGTDSIGVSSTAFSRSLLSRLAPSDCRRMAHEMCKLDMLGESHSVLVARQLIIDQHTDWLTYLKQLTSDWSGEEQYKPDDWILTDQTEYRLFFVELAVNAYLSEMNRLPDSIDELVPFYLPRIPSDPFGNGPIKYLAKNGRYKVYSNGSDRDDDGGISEDLSTSKGGDQVHSGPMPPPLWQQITDGLKSTWRTFSKFVKETNSAPR